MRRHPSRGVPCRRLGRHRSCPPVLRSLPSVTTSVMLLPKSTGPVVACVTSVGCSGVTVKHSSAAAVRRARHADLVVAREHGPPAVAVRCREPRRVRHDGRRRGGHGLGGPDLRAARGAGAGRVQDAVAVAQLAGPAEEELHLAVEIVGAFDGDESTVLHRERARRRDRRSGEVGRAVAAASASSSWWRLHWPRTPREKSKIVAVSDVEDRVSAMNTLKHLPSSSVAVRLIPPSKNSEIRSAVTGAVLLVRRQPRSGDRASC